MTDLGQPVAVDGNGTLSASFRAAFANDLKLCLASSDLTKCRAELSVAMVFVRREEPSVAPVTPATSQKRVMNRSMESGGR